MAGRSAGFFRLAVPLTKISMYTICITFAKSDRRLSRPFDILLTKSVKSRGERHEPQANTGGPQTSFYSSNMAAHPVIDVYSTVVKNICKILFQHRLKVFMTVGIKGAQNMRENIIENHGENLNCSIAFLRFGQLLLKSFYRLQLHLNCIIIF